MLTLRNLLTASAIAVCATTAFAQSSPSDAPPGSTIVTDASGQQMVVTPIPCSDQSMINRCNDDLVKARVASTGGDASNANMKMTPKSTVDDRDKGK